MKQVKFERRNKLMNATRGTIQCIARTATTKQDAVNRLRDILSDNIKLGYGGSHVWGANQKNERLFIITGY